MRGLEWKKDGEFKKTRTPQIKTSTVNYWHNLPVPVFIFVADLKIKDIFFMSVGHSIRNNYQKLTNQKTMSFRLLNKCNLSSQDGLEVFEFMYLFESSYEDLIPYIIGLLTRIDEFVDFIKQYQGLDQFLELELPEHLLFRTIYESCCRAEAYFRLEQSLPPLRDIYNKDVQDWGESYGTLHYGTVDYSLNILSSVFPAIIKRSMKMITDEQAYYWMRTDPFLFKVCTSGEMDWSLQRTENLP